MNVRAALATAGVFIGCCSGVVFLELLVHLDPGAGNLITVAQFVFIALEGFLFTSKCGRVKRIIGIKNYALLVLLFFLTSLCNNYVFKFNVPMTLHMIIRSGSLISNMCLGIIILKRQYRFNQYLSVVIISLGIFICTYFSSREAGTTSRSEVNLFWWLIGVLLLIVAQIVSSYMGILQELLYKRHGKHAREALYYTHLLSLPAFLILYDNIATHWSLAFQGPHIELPLLGITIPLMLMYLIGNVLTQHLCISSVYALTTECTSLTVTLILTLRKFISILFSIVYFQNPFMIYHWFGTIMVFGGTLLFADVFHKRKPSVKND